MKKQILNKPIGGMRFILFFILFLFSFSAIAGVPSGEKIKPTKLVTEPAAVKGQVLVKFKNANQQQNIRSVSALGVSVEKYYAQVGNIALLTINDENVSVKEMVQRLNQTAGNLIEYAEPNYKVNVLSTPNDTRFNDLWGMHNTGQTGGVTDADIDAVEAWSIATDASNIVIAIIDTGVDYTHPDLVSNMWRNPGEIAGNGIDDDNNGHIDDIYGIDTINNDSDPMDDRAHGTHVAGTIGGSGNNNQGVTGVAWNVQIMAIKFLGPNGGSTAGAIAAINYAVDMKVNHNINVVLTNNSWGGGGFSQSLKDAIDASGAANMLFIAAAGNVGTNDNDTSPHYPSSFTSANIIAVASSNENDGRSYFSSYGLTSVDLAAPGSNIWSTTPNNSYDRFNGTSMATPHVSGAAALLWSTLTNPSAADVKQTLLSTVDTLSAFNGITVTGGRLNIYNALNDNCDPTQYRFNTAQQDGFSEASGVQTVLTASLTNCAPTTGATVTASFNNGAATVNLLDDGAAPDVQANDGVYSAHWTPGNAGAVAIGYIAIHNNTTYTLQRTGTITEQVVYQVDDQHAFNWIDISSTGTNLNFSDDTHFFPVDFAFNFYGRDYTQIDISSNGGVHFQDTYLNYSNVALPTTTGSSGIPSFIALMWDDIDPRGGAVYYEIQGTKLIIQYDHTPRYGNGTNGASFQVILDSSNGNILMQYLDVDFGNASYNGGASATIGLQDTPDFAQQYSYNTASVSDNQAILWSPNGGSTTPAITSPADGSTLTSADVTFEFSGPSSVTNWWLYLGPTAGSARYFNSGLLPANATHVDVTGLPVNGSTIHATLWYQNGNGWEAARSSYTTTGQAPEITAPVDGSTLTGSNVTFEFDGAASVSNWWLYIGSAPGNARYYNSGLLVASTRSVNVTGLPLDSSTVYARLWYNDGSGWLSIDASYTAAVVTDPVITSPTPNSTLTNSSEIFSWTAGQATVDKWWVYVGSTHGGRDLYNSGDLGTSTSRAISNLPTNGSTLHVRLWYLIGGSSPSTASTLSPSSGNISITSGTQAGTWYFEDFMYTAATLAQTEITSPMNGSTLSSSNVTFEFSGSASITGWWVYIGSAAGRSNYYDSGSLSGSATSVDATGLPTNGSTVHATLWYRHASGGWQSAAFSYTAAP